MAGKIWTQSTISLTPVSDEPDMSSIGSLFYSDTMDGYASIAAMAAVTGNTLRIMPNPSPPLTSSGPDTTKNQLVTGRGGTGKALRMFWDGTDQYSAKFQTWPEGQNTGANRANYWQYWFRVTMSQGGSTNPDVKFFEMWLGDGSNRTQSNTRYRVGPSTGDHHDPVFEALHLTELASSPDADSQQPIGPYPVDLFDGNWHRHTAALKSHTSSGNKDGFQRHWMDGVKVIDLCQAQVGVTPPNGVKAWCTQGEVDRMAVNKDWGHVLFGGPQTTPDGNFGAISWTLDVDDFLWRVV